MTELNASPVYAAAVVRRAKEQGLDPFLTQGPSGRWIANLTPGELAGLLDRLESGQPATTMEIHVNSDGDWAALYVNGRLRGPAGAPCLREEDAHKLCGVKTIRSDAFLRGTRDRPAGTLAEIEQWLHAGRRRETRAADLRAEAGRLIERARRLEEGADDG